VETRAVLPAGGLELFLRLQKNISDEPHGGQRDAQARMKG
jgi:hypothetical protein